MTPSRTAVPVTLRPATPADAPRVADILRQARAAFMPYAPSAHLEPEVREWVAQHLVPTGSVTVAMLDEKVVGVMAVAHEADCRWINQMMVDPANVGKGIGSQLLAHAMATLPAPIRLWTFQANTGAKRFYERHGFVVVKMTDGADNEERCPDVLYEWATSSA